MVHIQVLMDLVVLQEAKEVLYPLVEVQQHKEQLLQVKYNFKLVVSILGFNREGYYLKIGRH